MALSASMQKELPRVRACLAQHPVERAWIFGSFSRGEEREDSDVDFLLQYDYSKKLSLMDVGRLYADLHDLLGRELDLVEDGYLYPYAAETANRDKILIYERKTKRQGEAVYKLSKEFKEQHPAVEWRVMDSPPLCAGHLLHPANRQVGRHASRAVA